MLQVVIRYYYSLADICHIAKDELVWHEKLDEAPGTGMGNAFAVIEQDNLLSSANWSNKDTALNRTMWQRYLWPEFCQYKVFYIDVASSPWEEPVEPTDEEVIDAFGEMAQCMLRWLDESTEKYSTLINAQLSIANKLLDQIGSENLTLFTDTPQNGSDWLSNQDDFVTNATKVSNKTDVATPIARLKEIQDNIKNYYADWADEFSRFVIFSA